MPFSINYEQDSGYFKGTISEKIDSLQEFSNTPLEQSLSTMLNRKEIILLDSETLAHSVNIDQKKETRIDTFRNKNSTIVSTINFGKRESQRVTLNRINIIDYAWNGVDSMQEVMMEFNPESFRHFSFYGKKYYYINANEYYTSGASARNIYYHFIWDGTGKLTGTFQTCRFNKMLAGDVNGDKSLDYLDFNNDDFCTTGPSSDYVYMQLYSADVSDKFILQKDPAGKPWFIEARTGDYLTQDSLNITNSHWPRPLR